MQLENQGLTLWYGTPEAPGPDSIVKPGEEMRIRIGVMPADASNRVSVTYRVNGGAEQTAVARWMRNDPFRDAQYFEANLGRFRDGDRVEYTPRCVCAGRRVPSPETAKKFMISFDALDDVSNVEKADRNFIEAPRKSLLSTPDKAFTRSASLANDAAPEIERQPERSLRGPIEKPGFIEVNLLSPNNGASLDEPSLGKPVVVNIDVRATRAFVEKLTLEIEQGIEKWSLPVNRLDRKVDVWLRNPGEAKIIAHARGSDLNGDPKEASDSASVTILQRNLSMGVLFPTSGDLNIPESGMVGTFQARVIDPPYVRNVECTIDNWTTTIPLARTSDPAVWQASVPLPKDAPRDYVAAFRCFDFFGQEKAGQSVTFRAVDFTPVNVNILSPAENEVFVPSEDPAKTRLKIIVFGTAFDMQTGIGSIEWSRDQTNFFAIAVDASGAFSFPISIEEYGIPSLTIRTRDNSKHQTDPAKIGNPKTYIRQFEVAPAFKAKTIQELLSPRRYLYALIDFIRDHLRQPGKQAGEVVALDSDTLTDVFYQPFGRLIYSPIADEPVNRLRVPIEVLRSYLGLLDVGSGIGGVLGGLRHIPEVE